MKVVVLGSKGMLGSDLLAACREAGIAVAGYDVDELDITDYQATVAQLPVVDCIVNCAAYTRVDDAETHRDEAHRINAEGARNVARVCTKKRMKMVYISTDYVFDGTRTRPYTERDQTNPVNIYGASKLAGEKAIRAEGGPYLILRAQSLFGVNGHNFVKSIRRKLKQADTTLRVVDDQISSPTYTRHLADAVLRLIKVGAEGIVHVAASRECTWFEFAQAIAQRVAAEREILPIKTSQLMLPAPRPAYSVLDTRKYRMLTGHVMPTWEQGLEEYLKEEGS
jgi:dTDP-4-dehydrorhamnose reductase